LICEEDVAVAVRPVGTLGAVVSVVTVTVTDLVAEPAVLVAVRVYVVVAAGDTEVEVPVTAPTPLLIDSVGAGVPVTVHAKVDDCPCAMVAGEAVNAVMAGAAPLVVAEAELDWADTFPAASTAATL
jgi:hypothetical protein